MLYAIYDIDDMYASWPLTCSEIIHFHENTCVNTELLIPVFNMTFLTI